MRGLMGRLANSLAALMIVLATRGAYAKEAGKTDTQETKKVVTERGDVLMRLLRSRPWTLPASWVGEVG